MLIEFIGCTGSGKTTISERVIKKLSNMGIKTISIHSREFYFCGIKLENETLQNIIMDFKAFLFVILAMKWQYHFLLFAIKVLKRNADSFLIGLNLFRSVIRKIGTYELLKRKGPNEIAVVDEGTVHTAHNLFVHLTSPHSTQDIIEFARLVPLSDIVVCVQAPKAVLLERTFNRKDPPRRELSRVKLERFVNHACDLFEELAAIERIRERLLTVNYFENSFEMVDALGNQIVNHILKVRKNGAF